MYCDVTFLSRNLTEALGRCGEVVEFMMQNILTYNCDLLHSALLHDASSHDWTNPKPYHENERSSLALQMWAFYMQGKLFTPLLILPN